MKRAFFSLILFFLLCALSNHTIDYTMGRHIENRSPYSLAFASIGAISLESRLDCWAKLRASSTENELQKYMQKLTSSLDLEYQPENVLTHASTDILEIEYSITQQDIDYYLALQSSSGETHFIVSAETDKQEQSLTQIRKKLDSLGILEWHDYYLYKGEINDTFNKSGTARLAEIMMKNLNAAAIDTYHEGMTYSSAGYSKDLEGKVKTIWSDGKRYNVQLAFYSSPSQDKTYVYIGFPLIVGNY
jgi:predicted transcriptional regulator